MKNIMLSTLFALITTLGFSQLTYIPDDAFETYLESTFPSCSSGGIDDYVIGSEVGPDLNILWSSIQNLIGIENLTFVQSINIGYCPNLNLIDLSNVNINNINITNLISTGSNVQGMRINIADCPNVTNIKIPQCNLQNVYVTGNLYLLNSVEFNNSNILKNFNLGFIKLLNNSAPNWDEVDLSMIQVELGCAGFQIENDFSCVLLNNNCYLNWQQLICQDDNPSNGLTCVQIENPGYALNSWPGLSGVNCSVQCNSCAAGINNQEVNIVISLSPNPTTSKITVKASLALIGKEFTIYDQLGKAVKSGVITAEETEIDLSNLSEGVYLFKAGAEMQETFKIIKQ
jgi:hypothetical protein